MLIIIALVVCAWLLASNSFTERVVVSLSAGLVASYIIAVMASLAPITTIPLDGTEVVRVFSPIAYPLSIQQYRDYSTNLFSYSVNFGWPQGFPLLQLGLMDDQSEFIHYAHFFSGLFLGLVLLVLVAGLVGILVFIERKVLIVRRQKIQSSLLLIVLQIILIIQISALYLSGNIIYPIGGAIVLIFTLYPALHFGPHNK